MRWGVQKKVINYIERNHLQKNWDIIIREIDTYFNSKFVEFDDDMRNIIENATFKIVKTLLFQEFSFRTVSFQKVVKLKFQAKT